MNSIKLRQEFHRILEQTVVPSHLYQNQKEKLYETWEQYSCKIIPSVLVNKSGHKKCFSGFKYFRE